LPKQSRQTKGIIERTDEEIPAPPPHLSRRYCYRLRVMSWSCLEDDNHCSMNSKNCWSDEELDDELLL
ncbi:MAG: hypothetical protein IPP19_15430, partial [Verrucomicrobia bacterium]|nr:hypothetical protein [Verrucomicrobiota bacterium]